jgi:hypothetical protein
MTQQCTHIREARGIRNAKPYASKFLEKHCDDLLRDDGDAKKSPAVELAESSSDDEHVEVLGDSVLGIPLPSLNLTGRFL